VAAALGVDGAGSALDPLDRIRVLTHPERRAARAPPAGADARAAYCR
jgi:hypothetical protein